MITVRRLLLAAAAGAVLALAATTAIAQSGGIGARGFAPPARLGDLAVKPENVSKVVAADPHQLYGAGTLLYSLRTPSNQLEGTLQITRFKPNTPWQSEDFQFSMVTQIGAAVPVVLRAGGRRVYLSSIKGLILTVWFRNNSIVILSIRTNYNQPKTVLRDALAVSP